MPPGVPPQAFRVCGTTGRCYHIELMNDWPTA
jgi:hypothetical protein